MTEGVLKIDAVLADIPVSLRQPLLGRFREIVRNYIEGRWEPSELNAGKFCEVVYTILAGFITGSYADAPSKPRNFVDACRSLEKAASSIPRSIRIQIPRVLVALYETRNNRGVSHIGGDVNPNKMDSTAVLYMSKWVLAELVRVFHAMPCDEAARAVESIVERVTPVVWKVDDSRYRVLNRTMRLKPKTLVLLYHHSPGAVPEVKLAAWLERKDLSAYRRDVLRQLHNEDLIDFDEETRTCILSPLGIRYVEEHIGMEI